jgi:hypothetical protein
MATIITRTESKRGCGFRKKGGMYFVNDGIGRGCGKLPIALTVCPCCNQGIKQSRGFTWITGALIQGYKCPSEKLLLAKNQCHTCPFYYIKPDVKLGLMWVGEKYYPSTSDFTREANKLGVSKRISQVPKDFVIGKTWICLAHPEAIVNAGDKGELEVFPGIFHAFQPSRIEYVITGKESPQELDAMEKRGFTLVDVIPEDDGEEEEDDES